MNDFDMEEIGRKNKSIRGYIVRSLAKGSQNRLLVKQISNSLMHRGVVISPDISKYLDYLHEAGYIEFIPERVTAYTAYEKEAVVKLTRKGVDLMEYTITDEGVEV